MPTILFVCEHGAAKSIIAATYFNQLASERGLDWKATARGTNTDDQLSKQTLEGLANDRLSPVQPAPQPLSLDDALIAARIVSFCELPADLSERNIIERWDGVPPVSQNYDQARDAILERIQDLLNKLRTSV